MPRFVAAPAHTVDEVAAVTEGAVETDMLLNGLYWHLAAHITGAAKTNSI